MAGDSIIVIKKKKGGHGGGHHGGSWKVAYADFMTAMMAFFLVMWILGLSEDTKREVASYFKDPFGKIKVTPKNDRIFSMKGAAASQAGVMMGKEEKEKKEEEKKLKEVEKKVEQGMQASPDLTALSKYVDMQVTQEGLRIEFAEGKGSVFFESGSALIRPQALALVKKISPILAKSGHFLFVEGHTDAQAYASTSYTNMDLSQDRAKSLYHALLNNGVPIDSFHRVQGCGASELKDPAHPLSFSNRRVSILLPFNNPTPTSDGLPKDALQDQIQGAFHKDLEIAR